MFCFNMSDNVDLSNHLCVSEDAFEEFQATTVCKQNVFDPPSQYYLHQTDLYADKNEMLGEMSVASKTKPQTHENIASKCSLETHQQILNSTSEMHSDTAGRSVLVSNLSQDVEATNSNCDVIVDFKCPSNLKKTNKNTDNTLTQVDSSEPNSSKQRKRQFTTRRMKPAESSEKAQSQTCTEQSDATPKRKRGRPRKNNTFNKDINLSAASTSKQPDYLGNTSSDSSVQGKLSENNEVDKKFDKIEHELERILSTPTNVPDENTSAKQINDNQNGPKKRGRKPKKQVLASRTEKNKNKVLVDVGAQLSNDEGDDMSLSILKKQMNSENIINEDIQNITNTKNENPSDVNRIFDETKHRKNKKVDTKKPVMSDFDYNINVATEETVKKYVSQKRITEDEDTETERSQKRVQILAKQASPCDERSAGVPLANVESSDDEYLSRSISERSYSKYECTPGVRIKGKAHSETSQSDILEDHVSQRLLNKNKALVKKVSDEHKNITEKSNVEKDAVSDFKNNIDSSIKESNGKNVNEQHLTEAITKADIEIESSSKRPVRNRVKKVLHYDEGSDEDPFANVELSDDDSLLAVRGGKYYSDDDYVPGKRKKGKACSDTSESDYLDNDMDHGVPPKKQVYRKRGRKSSEAQKKLHHKRNKHDVTSTAADTTTEIGDDVSLQSPNIDDNSIQTPQTWGVSHEFENFLAKKIQGTNLQIKKVSGSTPQLSAIAPLEIPVLDPNEPKKYIEMCTQTSAIQTKAAEVQTTQPYESTIKTKIPLTNTQSKQACEFLEGIVKTTSDLGKLMIEKSEDFIAKKINVVNITDTAKMDYCVQKSFLLFKLAKHNLIQMEEDLALEYEKFLKLNNLSQYRETPKCITATPKPLSSDSDCEIVEEPAPQKKKEKSKFNMKTVFLNKELSIKMAKKSTEEPQMSKDKLNIKGRHTVWINDSVMVKKVKPTQSFLAQDSRNKKPPDTYVTIQMVKAFFDNYYKQQKVLLTCAPFVSTEWLNIKQVGICNYFIDQSSDLSMDTPILTSQQEYGTSNSVTCNGTKDNLSLQPVSLQTLCIKAMQKYLYQTRRDINESYQHFQRKLHYQPSTLFSLSFKVISHLIAKDENHSTNTEMATQFSSLRTLSLKSINGFIHRPLLTKNVSCVENESCALYNADAVAKNNVTIHENQSKVITNEQRNIKTLFSSCIDVLHKTNLCAHTYDINKIQSKVKSLKHIAFQNVKYNMYYSFCDMKRDRKENINSGISNQGVVSNFEHCLESEFYSDKGDTIMALTIESVNTLSDDIFLKLPDNTEEFPCLENDDDDSNFSNDNIYDYRDINQDKNLQDDSNWDSRVELLESKSGLLSNDNTQKILDPSCNTDEENIITQIKTEPFDEMTEKLDSSAIKIEPIENSGESINFAPLFTKVESTDNHDAEVIFTDSISYDDNTFETFVRRSKILPANSDYTLTDHKVYSQSELRIRKQYEPDIEDDIDTSMSLLVPQQSLELAKDRLMDSSSDCGTDAQKNVSKKKRKVKSKSSRYKNKDTSINKEKSTTENEVALLTKKMQTKIRQEEKRVESSDSELENSLALRRSNLKKAISDNSKPKLLKEVDNQIQCNDVDSTENIHDNSIKENNDEVNKNTTLKVSVCHKKQESFVDTNDAVDQAGMGSYEIQSDAPVELLECEPLLPIMDDDADYMETYNDNVEEKGNVLEFEKNNPYNEKHGWKCFPLNNNDSKLYAHTYVLLEKLPDSFVDTYIRYQNMAHKRKEDVDVDRLTNLQTLQRNHLRGNKIRNKLNKASLNGQSKHKEYETESQTCSPNDNNCNELSPSEDEGLNVDNESTQPAPRQDAMENAMAKDCLMGDADSDSGESNDVDDGKKPNKSVKEETRDQPVMLNLRSGTKPKCGDAKDIDSLMLTADKMMNKELALLHGPVNLDEGGVQTRDNVKKRSLKTKSISKQQAHLEQAKVDDDSSSEEEKQWVTTKEKLLKKMGKKQENPTVDDAKRAKIVSEFIEKRGDAPDKRTRSRPRSRRSSRKFLERQKQISVLNRELLGEADTSYSGRTYSNTFSKGRKNIRKVIDKKSLARSTVVANMEEFERKRRLSMQQTRLIEQLGCEEGVNVLVINDEVCLEYDFEQMCPIVTIHPFFTKVMKAHQYEGVKFMWDACFESLSMVESGHAGGGCILAHCMGLGKTLQVLALLHTVLTHPRVGMRRVLVCCPLSTVLNWVDEIHKWIGPVTNKIKVFELSKLKKTYERAYQLDDWYNGGGIFIIGYELFRSLTTLDPYLDDIRPTIVNKIRNALLDPGPDVVICDEGHLLKNDSSVLAAAMSRVVTKRRIILTGTPMQNNLREYYCMVNFVKPSLLGTYAEYSNRFENPIMNGQHRDSREEDIKLMKARTHILHKVLEGCLQRQEASVLYPYLPKKYEYTVFIPLTECQWDLYKHYIKIYAMQLKQSVLKDFHVLQKIWTHPQVLHNFLLKERDERHRIKAEKLEDDLAQEDLAASEDIKPIQTEVWWLQYLEGGGMLDSLDSSNKFLVVFQLLDECIALGDKILIFSTSLYTLDALEYFLKRINKWSLGQQYYRLDGSVPAEVRQKWCREFNAEQNVNTKLFLISTRAGCLGLNMTAANRVIILDTSWNPAHDIQSIFRVYRFGQKKDCYIYRLVAMGTMEQKIYERSVAKQAVSCRVVDEQQIDRHYNMAELTELYRFDEEGSSVEAGLAAGVADVALLRVAARARLHAVREHDSLLRGSREQHLPEHERDAAWMQFQEEHANKEMQNRLLEASQGIQRFISRDVNGSSGSAEIKAEHDEQAQATAAPPKGKKGKKASATNSTPSQDIAVNHLDPDKEDRKVKKIMELLIKHNFHISKSVKEIGQLVADVRAIVDAGGAGLEDSDELTRSIASVMMQEEDALVQTPAHTITGDLNTPVEIEVKPDLDVMFHDGNDSHHVPDTDTRKSSSTHSEEAQSLNSDYSDGENSAAFENEILQNANRTITPARLQDNRKSSASDLEESQLEYRIARVSKEYSDGDVIPVVEPFKIERGKRHTKVTTDSHINVIDDDENNDATDTRYKSVVVLDEPVDMRDAKGRPRSKRVNRFKPYPAKPADEKPKENSQESNMKERVRRKAAVAAEQHLDTFNVDDIVTVDDDDDEWVCDKMISNTSTSKVPSISEIQKSYKATTVSETQKSYKATKATSVSETLNNKRQIVDTKSISTKPNTQSAESNSILLSDDEEVAEPVRSKNREPAEVVPLHPSMLRNPLFIKIVSYTYQSDRLLKEDAALLAAQYSAQIALTEYETTGNPITSGDIYDIAIKVLGKEVLKKLWNGKLKTNTLNNSINASPKVTMSVSDNYSRSTNSIQGDLEAASVNKRTNATTEGNEKRKENLIKSNNTRSVPTPQPEGSNVVPVGMFISSFGMDKNVSMEECILPDDDDVIFKPDNAPPAAPNVYRKPNSQPFIITGVSSSKSSEKVASVKAPVGKSPQKFLTISNGKLVASPLKPETTAASSQAVVASSVRRPAPANDTICIDSDEDEVGSGAVGRVSLINSVPAVTVTTSKLPATKPKAPSVQRKLPSNNRSTSLPALAPETVPRTTPNNFQVSLVSDAQNLPILLVNDLPKKPPSSGNAKTAQKQNLILIPSSPDAPKQNAIDGKQGSLAALASASANGATEHIVAKTGGNKLCKPGDIVRINRKGEIEVLSRVDKLPENILKALPSNSSELTVTEVKLVADRPAGAAQGGPAHDPLSILRDVIHIRADEYIEPDVTMLPGGYAPTVAHKATRNTAITEDQVLPVKKISDESFASSLSKICNVPNAQNKKAMPVTSNRLKYFVKSTSASKPTHGRNIAIANNTPSSSQKRIENPKATSTVLGSSSTNIILRALPPATTAIPVSKTASSANNRIYNTNTFNKVVQVSDSKKRASPWPAGGALKKKCDLSRPNMTLKDFNIDDIDDIIELE